MSDSVTVYVANRECGARYASGNDLIEEQVLALTAGYESSKLGIVPNPSNGIASIYYQREHIVDGKITITNIFGQVVYQEKTANSMDHLNIDLSNLAQGVYFVNLYDENRLIKTSKMVINK
jgi:hypothetical protein